MDKAIQRMQQAFTAAGEQGVSYFAIAQEAADAAAAALIAHGADGIQATNDAMALMADKADRRKIGGYLAQYVLSNVIYADGALAIADEKQAITFSERYNVAEPIGWRGDWREKQAPSVDPIDAIEKLIKRIGNPDVLMPRGMTSAAKRAEVEAVLRTALDGLAAVKRPKAKAKAKATKLKAA